MIVKLLVLGGFIVAIVVLIVCKIADRIFEIE